MNSSLSGMAEIFDGLSGPIGDAVAERVILGVNWTLVTAGRLAGLAQTPTKNTPGCRPLTGAGQLTGRSLAGLAAEWNSDNPMNVAIALAAINAWYNRTDLAGGTGNGLDLFQNLDGPLTVIGRFPGLDDRLPGARIVEREPKEGEYSEAQAPALIAGSAGVIITASTLVNGTLAGLLEHAQGARLAVVGPGARLAVVGPGTPLAPVLYEFGIQVLAGFVVEDPEIAARVIAEGGAVKSFKSFGRYHTLQAPS